MTNIVIVGEAFGDREERLGKPFAGPSGKLLDAFLAAAGLARRDCFLTNVFNFKLPGNKTSNLNTRDSSQRLKNMPALDRGYVDRKYQCELDRLYNQINAADPNLIIALGRTACWALLKDARITKLRGYQKIGVTGHKVLPTFNPANVLRDYKQRPIVFSDFQKAAYEAQFPEVRRPERELWLRPTIEDLKCFDKFITASKFLTTDIETAAKQITCIGFAPNPEKAIVIPFVDFGSPGKSYWSFEQELIAWSYVRKWLASPVPKVNQNIMYDIRYLWELYGIPVHNVIGDTMLRHHAMQPEMEKSLGFLGSIYSHEPSWKNLRADIKTLKKED